MHRATAEMVPLNRTKARTDIECPAGMFVPDNDSSLTNMVRKEDTLHQIATRPRDHKTQKYNC